MTESGWAEHSLNEVETVPKEQLTVTFGDHKLETVGQVLTPTIAQNPPLLKWTTEAKQLYSVFMMDPDAPSRAEPKYREWYHWGVVNISGCDLASGEVVAKFIGAGPPEGTGLHRYIILIYKQQCRVQFTDAKLGLSTDNRGGANVQKMAQKYNLGSPIAGACFQAEWDDYVPLLYQKLSA